MNVRRIVVVLSALAAFPAAALELSFGALTGYQAGTALRITGTARQLVRELPALGLSVGAGYASMDPGNPAAARRVFINDATNGTPQERGGAWDLRLDAVWSFKAPYLSEAGATLGIRRNAFSGRFRYVGGNEDFTIESQSWGVGAGFQGALPLSARWGLAFAAGLDWFPEVTLYGHDTSYSSSGAVVNGLHDYTFADASAAVNRPRLLPSLLVGLSWRP